MPENIEILLGKLLSGNNTETEAEIIKLWRKEDPANEERYNSLKQIWNHSGHLKIDREADVESAWNDFAERAGKAEPKIRRFNAQYLRIAAGIALIACLSVIVTLFLSDTTEEKPQYISMKNVTVTEEKPSSQIQTITPDSFPPIDSKEKPSISKSTVRKKIQSPSENGVLITLATTDSAKAFLLPDNSLVYLNEHSTLVYQDDFNINNRKISLDGEAYFQIEKDTMPFTVACHNTITRGREGSFNIKGTLKSEEVEVIIVSGNAEFSGVGKREYKKLVLKEGERGTFDRKGELLKAKNQRKDYKWWQKKNFRAKIKRIIEKIKQQFKK